MDVNLTTGRIVLLVLHWLGNVINGIGFALVVFGCVYLSTCFQVDASVVIICAAIIFIIASAVNRALYEMCVAIFEIVKHLRQIRDQLCIMNAQETEE